MGDINVYTGPMKCGKTQKILDEVQRQKIAGKNIMLFKPSIDTRFGKDYIVSRDGKKLEAIQIENLNQIKDYEADVYIIDEFQFLDGDLNVLQELTSKNKKFYISGLNLTSECKPFGKMGELMCMADNVNMLTAICENCRCENAIFTYYKGSKDSEILIGDSEYMPLCRNCYNKLMQQN